MGKVAFVSLLLIYVTEISATDYCRICEDHTMCLYKGIGPKCSRRVQRGVTRDDDKRAVVDIHNRYRRNVAQGGEQRGAPGPQPPAANMESLKWDDELARVAQRWADQCNFSHDKCRNVDRYGWVGQNLYLSGIWRSNGVAPDDVQEWEIAIGAFYNEVQYFNNKNVDSMGTYKSVNVTGHYSQLVWGTTSRVGCGFVSFMEVARGKDWFKKYYVCNYGPGGNVFGAQVYARGPPCSMCSASSRCNQGLCFTLLPWRPPVSRLFPYLG